MPTMTNAHALVAGIANYQYIRKLPETVLADARDVARLLALPSVCGYPEENIQLLLDGDATLTGIRQALAALAAETDAESAVLIYFTGHGGVIAQGPDAGEYLLPVDTRLRRRKDTVEEQYEPVPETSLSGDEFTEALRAIPARKVVVLFDCCHSGGIGEVKAGVEPAFKSGLPESYYERLAAGRGRVIVASSRDSEYSWVLPDDNNSLFTKHLRAGLEGGAPSHDGLIRIFDLFEYLYPRVTGEKAIQHPVFQAKLEENFPVALYLGGQKAAEPAAAADDFRYDAYISWVRAPADTAWMRDQLLPRLKQANLHFTMTGRVEEPGVPSVIGVQRAVELSKRTVVVLSRAYLGSDWAALENVAAAHLSVEERRARLLPVVIDDSLLDWERHLTRDVPLVLRQLTPLDVVDEFFGEENLARLPEILKLPIPVTR